MATANRRRFRLRALVGVVASVILALSADGILGAASTGPFENERPDDPPGLHAARDNPLARSPGASVVFGVYRSIQVNVDTLGRNILGDAANEPSIAVNPTNPLNMVIGWRQFNTVTSNFRQAGWAYTFDGGQTWTFPGTIGSMFGSDPVLDADSHGTFFYQSLTLVGNSTPENVYRSTNGGRTWSAGVAEYGGDKNWIVVDRTGGASDGYVYGTWQPFSSCCGANIFTRSVNGGASYQTPVFVAGAPRFGTIAVGPTGEVYENGVDGTGDIQDNVHFVVAKSTNASNPAVMPTFTGGRVNLGGGMGFGAADTPNPSGLLGQTYISVDSSSGAARGNVYVTATVGTKVSTDPTKVRFIRSQDGGSSWSTPIRVDDDPSEADWQWFGAHSVAKNGRIDMIWNDTRNSGQVQLSQVFYAYSWDGGATWSPNVAVSPLFDSTVGYPQQTKIGDYTTIVSNDAGADVAYAATFNNEEDVYYLRVFPDCNGNGVSDVTDIANATSLDCDGNHVPDECQTAPICGPSLAYASTLAATSCPDGGDGDGDTAIDPGEDAVLTVSLRNNGTVGLTHVTATLSTSTPGVTVTRAFAAYPDIPAHGVAPSMAPQFAIDVGTSVPCGAVIDLTIAGSADQGTWARPFTARVGKMGTASSTIDSTDVPKLINYPSVSSVVSVADSGNVANVAVGVSVASSSDGDLVFTLIGPNGARVLLANGQGYGGANYTNTVYDDGADTGIWNGAPPFTGPFKPEQPLSTFAGIPAAGTWTLEIADAGSTQTAKLTAWSLRPTLETGYVCTSCALSAPTVSPIAMSWSPDGKAGLQWESIPDATFYNVYRGVPSDLPNLLSGDADSCRRLTTTATATGDVLTEVPPEGSFFWYLVRASNGAGEGPPGDATAGPRIQDSSGDCPP